MLHCFGRTIWFPLFLGFFCLLHSPANAHPHVFIDYYVSVIFGEKGLSGFQMKWVFDEMTSAGFIMDYDTDGDGDFNPKELQTLKREVFDNLRNYNYMGHVAIDGLDFKVQYVKDFSALIEDGKLVYRFIIPCTVTAIKHDKKIQFSVYDEEFYIDFTLRERKIQFETDNSFSYSYQVKKNLNKSYYFDQLHPIEIEFIFSKR